jgi:hypothetical protein
MSTPRRRSASSNLYLFGRTIEDLAVGSRGPGPLARRLIRRRMWGRYFANARRISRRGSIL